MYVPYLHFHFAVSFEPEILNIMGWAGKGRASWSLCYMYVMLQQYLTVFLTKTTTKQQLNSTWFSDWCLLFAGKWSSPPTTGTRPPPSYFFSFTAINNHQAVFFGGNQPQHQDFTDYKVNDCFLMDFESMVRSEICDHYSTSAWMGRIKLSK